MSELLLSILRIGFLIALWWFEFFVFMSIIANTVVLTLYSPTGRSEINDWSEHINSAITIFFIVEMILKLLGLGLETYFSTRWNMFDFTVVCISAIDFFPVTSFSLGKFALLRILRLLRICRRKRLTACSLYLLGLRSFVGGGVDL